MAFISQQYTFYTIRENPNYPDLQQATLQIGKWPNFRILGLGLTLLPHKRHGTLTCTRFKQRRGHKVEDHDVRSLHSVPDR